MELLLLLPLPLAPPPLDLPADNCLRLPVVIDVVDAVELVVVVTTTVVVVVTVLRLDIIAPPKVFTFASDAEEFEWAQRRCKLISSGGEVSNGS